MFRERQLNTTTILSAIVILLATVAAGSGLFVSGLYEPFTQHLIGAYAQDIITLVACVGMALAVWYVWHGSARAVVVWAGCLAYVLYGYLLFSFDEIYTSLMPAYIAIAGLTTLALITLLGPLNIEVFCQRIDKRLPAHAIALVLLLPVLMAVPWLAFIREGIAAGESAAIHPVLVLDLGFVIPFSITGALLLWQRHKWGFVLAGVLLIKMITMTVSLLISTAWAVLLGSELDPVWPLYAMMTVLGTIAFVRYWQHIDRSPVVRQDALIAPIGDIRKRMDKASETQQQEGVVRPVI